jgi:hypothetical protein
MIGSCGSVAPNRPEGDECGSKLPSGSIMIVIGTLVAAALMIMAGALGWGCANGTMAETAQERVDREFERIVAALGRHSPG